MLLPAKYHLIQVQTSELGPGPGDAPGADAVFMPPGRVWVRLNQGGKCPRGHLCAGGKWGLSDLAGRLVVPIEHEYLEPQAGHLLRVARGGTCETSYGRVRSCSPETKWGLIRLEPVK